MLAAILDRYPHALQDAFADEGMGPHFWDSLFDLKEDTPVGWAGSDQSCPLNYFLTQRFLYDDVRFKVTHTHVLVYQETEDEEAGDLILAIPLPPPARRFVLFVDRGGPRGPIQFGDDHRAKNPPINAGEAFAFLRMAYGHDPTDELQEPTSGSEGAL